MLSDNDQLPGGTHMRTTSPNPVPTGLYVHIPFCDGKCGYCAFYSTVYSAESANAYVAALLREASMMDAISPQTVYFGGGTPSILSPSCFDKIVTGLKTHHDLANVEEWTVEINPGSAGIDKLRVMKQAGVNRISVGAQSFDSNVLELLGRRHSTEDTLNTINAAREAGYENIGLDLIACVPGVSLETWRDSLNQAKGLPVTHISVYALTVEEGTRIHRERVAGRCSGMDEDVELEWLGIAEQELASGGYARYEISNYAIKGYECLHNLACWQGERYLGIGPSACSHAGMTRYGNVSDLDEYMHRLERGVMPVEWSETLTPQIKAAEEVVFGLRMTAGIAVEKTRPFVKSLEKLARSGLVEQNRGRWRLTERGVNLADRVGADLMP